MADNGYISKIKLATGDIVTIKDAQGRADMTTLLGGHALAALKAAAWLDVDASLVDGGTGVATSGTIKSYVDSRVGAINKFDIKVVDSLPTAGADTMYILYLVAEAGAESGTYVEYITVRSGSEGAYSYAMEKIGTTAADLTDYVKKTCKVAGIDLANDITVVELQGALDMGDLSHMDKGSVKVTTADSITGASYTPEGSVTIKALTQTETPASLTMGNFTPAGSITGSAISGGSINVTLKDSTTKTEATLSKTTFTPAGTVAAVEGGDFSALKSATFGEDAANGVQIEGEVSAPSIGLTSSEKTFVTGLTGGSQAKFVEGAFTPASISEGFLKAGTQAKYSHTGFVGGSLGDATKSAFATEGLIATGGSGDEADTLIFSAAGTSQAVTAQGIFTPAVYGTDTFTANTLPSIDITKFSGGSKAKDTFTPNELQDVSTGSVNDVTAASLSSRPVFTGKKYKVATTSDTALKTVAFTATNSADIVNKVEYVNQDIDAKTFTPVAATLGFKGTEAENVLVTGVTYDKATANGASFSGTAATITPVLNSTQKTIDVEFSKKA